MFCGERRRVTATAAAPAAPRRRLTGADGLRSVGRMKLHLWLGVVAALGLACNGGGGSDGGETGKETGNETGDETGEPTGGETGEPRTEVALADFYEEAEVAFCTWQTACRQYGVEARCRSVNHLEDRLSMQRISGVGTDDAVPREYMDEAVKVGRIGYDAKAAAVCLDYIAARSCERESLHEFSEAELAGRDACEAVFKGRMGANGPCMAANECAQEAICGFSPTCTDACCVGACRVLAGPAKLGEACSFNTSCEPDTFCDSDPNTGLPTVCKASPKLGQACPQGSCAGESFCDYELAKPVCVAPRPVGSSCYSDFECAQPGYCVYDGNGVTGARCAKPSDEGGPCNFEFGDYRQCLRFDNQCGPSNKCEPMGGKGAPCDYNLDCAGDFFCSETAGSTCTPVADAGEFCGYDTNYYTYTPCSGDHYCSAEFESGKCTAPTGEASCPVPVDSEQGG